MADFATAPLSRDQLVLFPERLDSAIAPDHAVRLLDDILGRIDWTSWEQTYDLTRGQPPIHPRVLAGAIQYGLIKRIRTSRALEEAIEVRNDFRRLVKDRRIDHTTICKFRQKNSANLKNLFVRIALVARELGHLPLASLGFDGTRLRANNRKSGTRTPEELRKAKEELAAKYTELEAQAAAADAKDDQRLGKDSEHKLDKELADVAPRQKRVDAALVELERLEQEGQKKPARIPITDPQSPHHWGQTPFPKTQKLASRGTFIPLRRNNTGCQPMREIRPMQRTCLLNIELPLPALGSVSRRYLKSISNCDYESVVDVT